jgi:flagellar basal-body rod protein FlgG
MNDALYIAATGLQAQQAGLNAVADNLANTNTPAFKAGRVAFADLIAPRTGAAASSTSTGGIGVMVSGVSKDFKPGELKQTGAALDIALQGQGFIEVLQADGSAAYTRGGTLAVNKDGLLTTASGELLKPEIQLPSNMTRLVIGRDGHVGATEGNSQAPSEVGRLSIVDFANPAGLKPVGNGLYIATEASGEPIAGHAGEDGMGTFMQGSVESANIDMNSQMIALMLAQRGYELSARVVQAADTLMELTNNLRR